MSVSGVKKIKNQIDQKAGFKICTYSTRDISFN